MFYPAPSALDLHRRSSLTFVILVLGVGVVVVVVIAIVVFVVVFVQEHPGDHRDVARRSGHHGSDLLGVRSLAAVCVRAAVRLHLGHQAAPGLGRGWAAVGR